MVATTAVAAASLSLSGRGGATPRSGAPPMSARGPQGNGILALSAGCPTGGGALLGLKGFSAGPGSARAGVKVPFLPGYGTGEHKTSSVKSASASAVGDRPALDEGYSTGKATLPKLDLAVLESLCDPMHRYNMSARSPTHDEKEAMKESARNTYVPAIPPAWLKHDRQVLRFAAFFKEPVHENPKENFRTRHCTIYFYLEDGTMMVAEPKVENSGIPQGTFVKRHRIPKPEGDFFAYQDLANSETIMIYSRAFRIYDCDDFTREFYQSALGVSLPQREEPPLDSFRASQMRDVEMLSKAKNRDIVEGKEYNELFVGGNRKNIKLQQYLENDRKVLRFQAFWDDPTKYGARMYYIFHYYLADDSVEILERLARNSGRHPYPVFWRRSELRKNPHINPTPGMLEPEADLYKPEDLLVGGHINVYGRDLFLYDCDDFTRDFYRGYMNCEQDKMEIREPELVHVKLATPPHTGIGDEQDSLTNCLKLQARPPRRDMIKAFKEGEATMRFEAKMVSSTTEDAKRRFVIGFFFADDSVVVWEKKQRNSGFAEGKFANKSKKNNIATGTWFRAQDFFVGAVIEINATPFELVDADAATVHLMEERSAEFPKANVVKVLPRLVSIKDTLAEAGDAMLTDDRLHKIAINAGLDISYHEVLTLIRQFGEQEGSSMHGSIEVAKLLAALEKFTDIKS